MKKLAFLLLLLAACAGDGKGECTYNRIDLVGKFTRSECTLECERIDAILDDKGVCQWFNSSITGPR